MSIYLECKVRVNDPSLHRLQKIMLFTLIIALLLIVIAVPSTSAKPISAEPTSEPVYLVKYAVNTTSDWTIVTQEGLSPFANNASVVSGGDAPGLSYSAGPGEIHIMKKQYDVTPVTLEASFLTLRGSDDGLISIESGALGETVVDIYCYSGSWTKIHSITHAGSYLGWQNFTVDYRQLYTSPSSSANIEPVPSSLSKTVFAFYYPWYGTVAGPTRQVVHWDEGYAHEPILGLYDSKDERVIEAHIGTAKAAGIDGFIVSWWGPGTFEDKALSTILRVAEDLNFSITIYYESYRSFNMTISEVVDELSYVVRTYSNSRAFLKADGMPVIFIYAVSAWDRSPSFWTNVVSLLEGRVGPTYLVGDFVDSKYAEAFDGCHTYGTPDPAQASQTYRTFSNNMRLGLKGINWDQAIALIQQGRNLPLEERFLAFTVHPGFDLTKIGGTLYLSRKDGQTYDEYWRGALSSDPDSVLITSWNEWHEGTEIEPSIEYGFAYINLTRQFVSIYKGSSLPIYSTKLALLSDVDSVLRLGTSNISISLINNSSNPAIGVKLTLNLGEGLSLQNMKRSTFYAYIEETGPRNYSVVIPFLKSNETLTFNVTLLASPGTSKLNASAIGYSLSGAPSQASFERQVQVVSDRVVVNLSSNSSRMEVGSEAQIAVSAHYEYDRQPFVGTVYLNDTLTKNSTGKYTYTVSDISDNLHGLTNFTSNTVSVTFDRITTNSITETTAPGRVSVTTKLAFESDGQPVDNATVMVNGAPAAETVPGTFQTTVTMWSPLYQFNITIERPGFSTQNIALSGYATGNIVVEAAVVAILLAVLILLVRRRGS